MGKVSKGVHVVLRVLEFACSVLVIGLLARFLHLTAMAGISPSSEGRIVYALVIACISTVYALLFSPPLTYAFMAFPADLLLFTAWLVAFCLLVTRRWSGSCGRVIGWDRAGYRGSCGRWNAAIAFSFIACFLYLLSAILGGIVVSKRFAETRGRKRNAGAGGAYAAGSGSGTRGPAGGPVGGPTGGGYGQEQEMGLGAVPAQQQYGTRAV